MTETQTKKKLAAGIAVIAASAVCLVVTTLAIVLASVSIQNNLFYTGAIKINLNDEEPIIRGDEIIFEPGMTVKKDFFIENESTWEVYYKIYFDNISGELADVLMITVKDGDKTICTGTASELTRKNIQAADDTLKIGQKKDLTVYFHYPENSGNEAQGKDLSFTLCAEATQTKNNPNKLFN